MGWVVHWFLTVLAHLPEGGSILLSSLLLHCIHHLRRTMLRVLPPIHCSFQSCLFLPTHLVFVPICETFLFITPHVVMLPVTWSTCHMGTCHLVLTIEHYYLMHSYKGLSSLFFQRRSTDFNHHLKCLQKLKKHPNDTGTQTTQNDYYPIRRESNTGRKIFPNTSGRELACILLFLFSKELGT